METVGYCVRVQAMEGYGDRVSALTVNPDYVAVLATRHEGSTKENPHYHFVVRTAVKPQAFRVRMKATFPDGKGNQHMSIKPWDGNNDALSYLFHELDDDEQAHLIARKGVSDELLQTLRERNTAVQLKVTEAKQKAAHTLEEDAYRHFKANPNKYLEDWQIGQFMYLFALRNGKYPPQAWLLKAMVTRVRFRLLEGDINLEEKLAEQLSKSIFCRYE